MATKLVSVESLLQFVSLGLEGDELRAFTAYLDSELGSIRKEFSDRELFGGLVLKGKGDKQKGTYDGGKHEFTGGHNPATLVIHFACLIKKQGDSLGIVPPIVDCSGICKAWAARRARKEANANPVNA